MKKEKRNVDLFKLVFILLLLNSCTGTRPETLGMGTFEGKPSLKACPDTPNCIVSHKFDTDHYVEPIQIISNKERAHKKITGILLKNGSAKIIATNPSYIYAEFTSTFIRFVDDVEFYFEDKLVHFRSASRIGRKDFGVNKDRIESIRFKFQQNDF